MSEGRFNLSALAVRERSITLFLIDLFSGHGLVVGKVKARALGVDQRALLLHMVAQHFAQGLVHDVRDRVVAHGGRTQLRVHLGLHGIAHLEAAGLQHAVVAEHIGLDRSWPTRPPMRA